jgi:hypothetical protein
MNTIGQVEVTFDSDFETWKFKSCDKLPVFSKRDLQKLDTLLYNYGQDGKNGSFALVVPSDDLLFDYKLIVEILEQRMKTFVK